MCLKGNWLMCWLSWGAASGPLPRIIEDIAGHPPWRARLSVGCKQKRREAQVKRSFLKRGLLLSAASATLLSVPAYAANLEINSATTTAVKTSAANNGAGDITIDSNGSITITQSGPAVTLDSSNDVNLNGSISNKNTTGAQGVLIDTGTNTTPVTLTGDFLAISTAPTTIDLSGSGTGKTGIGITGNGTLTGTFNFNSGTIAVQGNSSTGIGMSPDTTLNGDFTFDGTIVMTPTTANDTSA